MLVLVTGVSLPGIFLDLFAVDEFFVVEVIPVLLTGAMLHRVGFGWRKGVGGGGVGWRWFFFFFGGRGYWDLGRVVVWI